MHIGFRLFRRLAALALPCWLAAIPLASLLQSSVCRRHAALHHLQHGRPADTACWCDGMTAGTTTIAPVAPALMPRPAALVAVAPGELVHLMPVVILPLESPAFPPLPPPPDSLLL